MIAPSLWPRTVQLCIHCQHNPAGFWVSRTNGQTVRRPWCLAYLQGLDRGRCEVIPFDRAPRTGPHRRAPHGGKSHRSHRAPGQPGRQPVRRLRTRLTGRIITVLGTHRTDLPPLGPVAAGPTPEREQS
jgi:hypothetical protein